MSDPRDRRSDKPPPDGVKAQIAPPEWDGDSVSHHLTPVEQPAIRPGTDGAMKAIVETDTDRLVRHSSETKNAAVRTMGAAERTEKATMTSFDRIEQLRHDTRRDNIDVNKKLDHTNRELGTLSKELGTLGREVGVLATVTAGQGEQNQQILDWMKEDRDRRARQEQNTETIHTVTSVAKVEVDTKRQISELDLSTAAKLAEIAAQAARRDIRNSLIKAIALRLVAGIAVVIGTLATVYLSC